MSKVRVYIVEDEPVIAATIESSLIKEGYDVIGNSDNINEAYFNIDDLQPDLVFLDIHLNDGDHGLSLGKKLSEKTNIPFIYLSSYSDQDTIQKAAETEPSGYLLKPFKSKDLKVAIDLALIKRQKSTLDLNGEEIFVKDKKRWTKIKIEEILFLSASDSYTELFTNSDKFVISQTLKKLEEKLPVNQFIRVHRSYLINLRAIDSMEEDLINIAGNIIPVSKSYRQELKSKLKFL